MKADSLTPVGEPPDRSARWCPSCRAWRARGVLRGRRRCLCGAAVVRQTRPAFHTAPGELRPGVVPEWTDDDVKGRP
jgi:hypothetical protein